MSTRNHSVEVVASTIEVSMAKRKENQRSGSVRQVPLEHLRVFGDPVLKQVTIPVSAFDSRLQRLAETLFAVMEREEGVGLAAPQVGSLTRIMVWRHPENEEERYVYINPRILAESEECCTEPEGCLSVPGTTMEVARAEEIDVEAQDLAGTIFQAHLTGLLARIVQHEIDHLDGRLILDRTSPEERRRALKELRERALAGGQ
jgi:peptide deformylase